MSRAILVLGSGKMARNIGLWFVRHGHVVSMVSSRPDHRDDCSRFMERNFKRLNASAGGSLHMPRVFSHDAIKCGTPDIVVEATSESLEVKQRCFKEIESGIGPGTLVLSTTSSIIPQHIHPGCIGMHFFYPVELTGFAEIISTVGQDNLDRVTSFASSLDLSWIIEDEASAFCANRLLLPVQAEAVRLMKRGYAAMDIDSCTVSDLLPMGQLSLIDAVGCETVYASVCNYRAMLPPEERRDYSVLVESLNAVVVKGSPDLKNRARLLPAVIRENGTRSMDQDERAQMSKSFLYLFVNTYCTFLERRIIDGLSLDKILSAVYRSECPVARILAREEGAVIARYCDDAFLSTGLSYFKPSPLLVR
jgi:3-hydroxyacyl-CoA dehydrogenase